MKTLLAVNILLWVSVLCVAQSGWNIGYVEINSLSTSHIGVPVRLDFTRQNFKPLNSNTGTISTKIDVRLWVTSEDTAFVLIDGVKTVLYEKRRIYADWGFFQEQFLEIENNKRRLSKRIEETEVLEIETGRIKVKATIRSYSMKKGKIQKELESESKEFWIEKDKLDGVMVEK